MLITRLISSFALVGALTLSGTAPASAASAYNEEAATLGCLAAAVYYEARSEPEAGQRAVAQVVLNRVQHPRYPKSVCGVVLQGFTRGIGCQFTFICDGSAARPPRGPAWERAVAIASDALSGRGVPELGNATHYHSLSVSPAWAREMVQVAQLGAHAFYATRGARPPVPRTRRRETPRTAPAALPAEAAYSSGVKVHRGTEPLIAR